MNVKVKIQIVNFFHLRVCFDNSVKYHFINLRIKGNIMLLFAFLQCTIILYHRSSPSTFLLILGEILTQSSHTHTVLPLSSHTHPPSSHTLSQSSHTHTIFTNPQNLPTPTQSSYTHTILIHSHSSPTFLTYSPPILTHSHNPHTLTLYKMFFVSRTIRKFSHLRIMISSVYCIQI